MRKVLAAFCPCDSHRRPRDGRGRVPCAHSLWRGFGGKRPCPEVLGSEPALAARPTSSPLLELVLGSARLFILGSYCVPTRGAAPGAGWRSPGTRVGEPLSAMYGWTRALAAPPPPEPGTDAGPARPESKVALGENGELVIASVGAAPPAKRYHSCFISYSSDDRAFVERLHADLEAAGVSCWRDRYDLPIGSRLRPAIDQAIRKTEKLLLVLSRNSVESDWVEKEVETAFEEEEARGTHKLFPIRLDDSVLKARDGWPADIRRSRHIGDFVGWEDAERYRESVQRLLRDLEVRGQDSAELEHAQADGNAAAADPHPAR